MSQERRGDVGLKGERAADVLFITQAEGEKLAEEVSQWAARLGIARQVSLRRLRAKIFLIEVTDEAGHVANVVDVGFGVSQVFPILVEGLYAPRGSTLLLEQPEIHLNPRVQAALGDFFVHLVSHRHESGDHRYSATPQSLRFADP